MYGRRVSILVGILSLLLCACPSESTGNGNGPPPGPNGDGLALEDFCEAFIDDVCGALMECYNWDYVDLEHCRADQECLGMADLEAEVGAGWLTYDESVAWSCHESFSSSPCAFGPFIMVPTVQEVLSSCPQRFVGNQPAGEACVDDLDCAAGTYCSMQNYTCPGTCAAWLGDGETCDARDGLRCDPALRCNNGTCGAPPAPQVEGDYCDWPGQCPAGLWCNVNVLKCFPQAGLGEYCVTDEGCEGDLWCPSEPGSGWCQAVGDVGGACELDEHCESGLVCFTSVLARECQPRSDVGGPCYGNTDCIDGLRCDFTAGPPGVCSALLGSGEVCMLDSDCSAELLCEENVCRAPRYPGEPCDDGQSVCILSVCDGSTCMYRAPLGGACTDHQDCASRECDAGVCLDGSVCFPG